MIFYFLGSLLFPLSMQNQGTTVIPTSLGCCCEAKLQLVKCFEIHRWICGIYRNSDFIKILSSESRLVCLTLFIAS